MMAAKLLQAAPSVSSLTLYLTTKIFTSGAASTSESTTVCSYKSLSLVSLNQLEHPTWDFGAKSQELKRTTISQKVLQKLQLPMMVRKKQLILKQEDLKAVSTPSTTGFVIHQTKRSGIYFQTWNQKTFKQLVRLNSTLQATLKERSSQTHSSSDVRSTS